MSNETEIFHLKAIMKHAEMQCNWWIAYATTQGNLDRDITKYDLMSNNQVQLTANEKIDSAMNTAQRHMKMYMECVDKILELENEND